MKLALFALATAVSATPFYEKREKTEDTDLGDFRILVHLHHDRDQLVSLKVGNNSNQLIVSPEGKDATFTLNDRRLTSNGQNVVIDDDILELGDGGDAGEWKFKKDKLHLKGHSFHACPLEGSKSTFTLSTHKCGDGSKKVNFRVFS
ncbi:hypothetical protein DICA3_D15082 [Diutina catenulata]